MKIGRTSGETPRRASPLVELPPVSEASHRPLYRANYAAKSIWDGEEPGLLGSTEWVEAHAAELEHDAVAYINSDTNARGFLQAGGSHSLQHLVNEVGASVIDPETHASVQARPRAKMRVDGVGKAASEENKNIALIAAR